MNENEVKTNDVESAVEAETENAQAVVQEEKTEIVQESIPTEVADYAKNQEVDYYEALKRLEEEKKAEAKKKKKKKRRIILGVIAAMFLLSIIKNVLAITVVPSIILGQQVDEVYATIVAEEYDSDEYESAIEKIDKNKDVSDAKKAKKYFKLGKEALKVANLDCYEDLFDKSIENNEKYKNKVLKKIESAIASSEDDVTFFDYAEYYHSLGGTLDDESIARVKTHLTNSVVSGKFSDFEKVLTFCESIGIKADDATNKKIYNVAMKAYKAKNYSEAYSWFNAYSGKKDIKATKKEATYEYVLSVLFGDSQILYPRDWAREMLSTKEMKNYKQAEGIRLYCNLMDSAMDVYRNSKNENAQDAFVKSKLLFPDSYRFIGKSVTSDYYMKMDGDNKAKICYDCTIVYSAMNRYGYTVTDTYDVTYSNSFSLGGSDYVLALKVFANVSDENMLKYARTGKFTNTTLTFGY